MARTIVGDVARVSIELAVLATRARVAGGSWLDDPELVAAGDRLATLSEDAAAIAKRLGLVGYGTVEEARDPLDPLTIGERIAFESRPSSRT